MANVNRQETMARRVRIYRAITAGQTYRQILDAEQLSDDALTDHLKAIDGQLQKWAAAQQNRALALAISTYQRVIDVAWAGYAEAWETQRKWLAGAYDRTDSTAPTIMPQSAAEQGETAEDRDEQPEPLDSTPGMLVIRKPPILRLQMQEYLTTIIAATKELAKLAGLEKLDVHLAGELFVREYQGVDTDAV